MPLARIVTRDYEEARPLCDRLRELGYTVEVFAPGQLRLSEVDLEIQVERVPLDKATRLAARRARAHESTVYVDRDLYAETTSRSRTVQYEQPISETTPERPSAEPAASPRLDAALSVTPEQHAPANPIEAASVTPEIVPMQAPPSAEPSAGWREKLAGWREQHAAAQEERRLIREKEDELRRQRRATEEARRALQTEQRRHAEEEERRRREQELQMQRQREEEERLRLLAEQQRFAAERAHLAEEQRRAEAERLRLAEEQRRIEEERQRIAAEARRRVEEERRRVAAEEQRQAEEARAHEERLARERQQAAPPVWSQSTAEIALPAATSHADRVPPPTPTHPPTQVLQTPHGPRRRAPRISRPAAAPDRRRQWEQAALFASVVALILMIGFALAMRQSTPFSSSSNLLPQNAVEQQVPFGPATATPTANTAAQRPRPQPVPVRNSAGAAPTKPSPAVVRRTPREEYIAPDEVVVHHYPQRHPPAATNSAGVRHISDME